MSEVPKGLGSVPGVLYLLPANGYNHWGAEVSNWKLRLRTDGRLRGVPPRPLYRQQEVVMEYLFERGNPRRVMHIERKTITGEHTLKALCRIKLPFNTTSNVPLGQRICKNCIKELRRS